MNNTFNGIAAINGSNSCSEELASSRLHFTVMQLIEYNYGLSVFLFVVNTILLLVSTIGNALVFLTIVYFQVLHVIPNIGMASLAAASCLTGIFAHSFQLAIIMSPNACAWDYVTFTAISFTVNVLYNGLHLSLCLLTIERFIGIVYCLRYTAILSVRRMVQAVIAVWVLSFSLSILDLALKSDYFVTRIIVYITMTCIVVCNVVILRISIRHKRQIAAQQMVVQNGPPPNFRGAYTVMLIFVILLVTDIPLIVTLTGRVKKTALESASRGAVLFYPWCLTLFFSKTTLYFVLYFWRSQQLRSYTKHLCRKIAQGLYLG